jgi:hypothetical protein
MIGETIWLDAMSRRIDECREKGAAGVVIDDLRFANEYRLLRDIGATIVRVERKGMLIPTLNDGHASELDWMNFTPDAVVRNDESVEELTELVTALTEA